VTETGRAAGHRRGCAQHVRDPRAGPGRRRALPSTPASKASSSRTCATRCGAIARWSRRGRSAERSTCILPLSFRSGTQRGMPWAPATRKAYPRGAIRRAPFTRRCHEREVDAVAAEVREGARRALPAARGARRGGGRANGGRRTRAAALRLRLLPERRPARDRQHGKGRTRYVRQARSVGRRLAGGRPEEAFREVCRRYLHTYGPARPNEFRAWFGSGAATFKTADGGGPLFESLGDLEEVEVQGHRAYVVAGDTHFPEQGSECPASARVRRVHHGLP